MRLMDTPSPQHQNLRIAFQKSSFKSLRIQNEPTITYLFNFIALFPDVEEVYLENTVPSFLSFRERPLHQFGHLLSLTAPYTTPTDRQFLDFVAQESVFPNIQNFAFGGDHNHDVFPVLRQLLSTWSTSLVKLNLLHSYEMEVEGSFLRLPSTLSDITLFIPLRESKWSAYNEFWAETLKQHTSFAKIHVSVTWPTLIVDTLEGANMDRPIALLDRALVERAEYLDWEDERIIIRPRRLTPLIATTYQWLFETMFPLTSERFFVGMPAPRRGGMHTNAIATRRHLPL